jgi:hypothetical protein
MIEVGTPEVKTESWIREFFNQNLEEIQCELKDFQKKEFETDVELRKHRDQKSWARTGVTIYIRGGNANEPGDDDGGPRQGSLSCLTISRKGIAAARPRLLLVGRVRIHQHNDPGIG